MLLIIDHHSGVPIYRQIMDQVREQIMAGLLREGEQVMTVLGLAASLNVNPMTVLKAYSAMEMDNTDETNNMRGKSRVWKIENYYVIRRLIDPEAAPETSPKG